MDIKQNMQGFFSFGEFGSKSIGAFGVLDVIKTNDSESNNLDFSSILEGIKEDDDIEDNLTSLPFSITPIIHSLSSANSEFTSLSSSEFCKIYKAEDVGHNSFAPDLFETLDSLKNNQNSSISKDLLSLESEPLDSNTIEPSTIESISTVTINTRTSSSLNLIDPAIERIAQNSQPTHRKLAVTHNTSEEIKNISLSEKSPLIEQPFTINVYNSATINKEGLENNHIIQKLEAQFVESKSATIINTITNFAKTKTSNHPSETSTSRQTDFFDSLEEKNPAKSNTTLGVASHLKANHTIINTQDITKISKEDIATLQKDVTSIILDPQLADNHINKIEEITIAKTLAKENPILQKQYDSAQTLESIKFNLSHSVVNDKQTIKFVLKPKELGRIEIKFENFDTKIEGINSASNNRPNVAITVESKDALNLLHTIKGEIEAAIASKLGYESSFSLELSMEDHNKNNPNDSWQGKKNSELGFSDEESYITDAQYNGEITMTDSGNINLVI